VIPHCFGHVALTAFGISFVRSGRFISANRQVRIFTLLPGYLGMYEKLARGFGVTGVNPLLKSDKANGARMHTPTGFAAAGPPLLHRILCRFAPTPSASPSAKPPSMTIAPSRAVKICATALGEATSDNPFGPPLNCSPWFECDFVG